MSTILNALASITNYPIPVRMLEDAAEENGLDGGAAASSEVRASKAFKRALARLYRFLSEAPNVSQGGVSFSFNPAEKAEFRKMAAELEAEADDGSLTTGYGWQGEDF